MAVGSPSSKIDIKNGAEPSFMEPDLIMVSLKDGWIPLRVLDPETDEAGRAGGFTNNLTWG